MSAIDTLYSLAAQSGVQVIAESNVSPPIVLFDASDTSPTLLDLLGIRPHVTVKTSDGKVLAEYGHAEPRNYLLVALLLAGLFVGVTVVGGSVVRALKSF